MEDESNLIRPVILRICEIVTRIICIDNNKNLAEIDPVIISYMVVNIQFMPLYGIMTGSLSAKFFERVIVTRIICVNSC